MKSIIVAILIGIFYIGCGSSGSSPTSISQGVYVDSAVDGVKYICGSQEGITGDTGVAGGFNYEKGADCTFYISDIILSKVSGSLLAEDNAEIKVKDTSVAIFLQSLDVDGNATNGITINSKIVDVLSQNDETSLPTTEEDVQRIVNLLSSADIGYAGMAISKKEAQAHLAGFSVNISASSLQVLEGQTVTLTANVEGNTLGVQYEWVGFSENSSRLILDNLSVGTHRIELKVTKDNTTIVDSVTIVVTPSDEFIVSIENLKSNYTIDENVVLTANINGDVGDNIIYTWKEGNIDLGVSTKTLTKKFSVGSHTISVKVKANGKTKITSIVFNVSDVSDFNITKLTITQNSKKLMWVNAPKGTVDKNNNIVCLAVHGDEYNSSKGYDDSFDRAKSFCSNMDFAGFANWRTPTVDELSNFIKDTNSSNIITNYDRPCSQLLALIEKNIDPLNGANYRAVTTIFMSKKYFPNIGTVRDHTYAKDVELFKKYNVGLRCVRNTDGTGGEDLSGANISVSITGAKSSYDDGNTVILSANITGATVISSYSWKENSIELGTGEIFSSSDFSVGNHTVTLEVIADGITKSSTVTFVILSTSDDNDFNRTTLTSNNDGVIIQRSTKLMWVDEPDVSKGKCAKIHTVSDTNSSLSPTEFNAAKTFCSSMVFAGFSDWRTPTSGELKFFIESTIDAQVLPAYDAKCKKLLALKAKGVDTSIDDNYVTVTTRYDTTNGAGIISSPGILIPNIGLRCVRDNN